MLPLEKIVQLHLGSLPGYEAYANRRVSGFEVLQRGYRNPNTFRPGLLGFVAMQACQLSRHQVFDSGSSQWREMQ